MSNLTYSIFFCFSWKILFFFTFFFFFKKGDHCNNQEKNPKKLTKATQVKRREAVRDLEWDTHTLPLGWSVQGIWPSGVDGSDINAVDRSRDYNFVASADDFGDVKIFNYPCTNTGSFFYFYFFFSLFHNNFFTS